MDQGTPRSHASRSSPEPAVFEPGPRIPSDRSLSCPANGYTWTIPADSNSIPRLLPGTSSPRPGPSVPDVFESVGDGRPANYTICSATRSSSSGIDQYRYSARGEQTLRDKNKYPAQPWPHSSPESDLTTCDLQCDRDSSPGAHASRTGDDTAMRSIANLEAGAGPPFPDRHERHPSGNGTHSEETKPGDASPPGHPDANATLTSEAQRGLASPGSISPITHLATCVYIPESASVPRSLPRLHRCAGRNQSPRDRTDQGLFKLPSKDNNHAIAVPDLCRVPRPPSEGLIVSSLCKGNASHDENVGYSTQEVTPALTQVAALSNHISSSLNLNSGIPSIDCSAPAPAPAPAPASASSVITPGLFLGGQQHDRRTPSTSSTISTGLSDVGLSDDVSPEDIHGPTSVALDSLRRQLTTCLLARLLWNSVSLDVQNLVETIRKYAQTSCPRQAPRGAGKRRLTESSSQSNSSSLRGESGGESDHGGEDAPGRRRPKKQRLDDPSSKSPPLLACPFHKMDPIRYSGLNAHEKEYRICSSGYWPDISRLK
jgi:hypothetical protein